MSALAVGTDDHPEAATKHLADAKVLLATSRYDGAAYLSGYVVECSLKSIIIHDQSYDSGSVPPSHRRALVEKWHKELSSRRFGHNLAALGDALLGKVANVVVGPQAAAYVSSIPSRASILKWRETLRYQREGSIHRNTARAFVTWAERVATKSVVQMKLNGVI